MGSAAVTVGLIAAMTGCSGGGSAGVQTPSPDDTEAIRQALNGSELGRCITDHGFPSSGSGFYDTRNDLTEGPDYEWVGGVSAADGSGHQLTLTYTIAEGRFVLAGKPYWDDEKAAAKACRKASGQPSPPIQVK